jgi:hypothetical protein
VASTGTKVGEPEVRRSGGWVEVQATLTGATPLLLNAMPRDVLLELAGVVDKKAKTAEKATPEDVARCHLHLGPDGKPAIPSQMLYAAMINAGVFVRLDGKRQVSTKTETNLPGLMKLGFEPLPLYLPGSEERSERYEVDIQRGVNPNGGQAVAIIRPCFYQWEIRPLFTVDRRVFDLKKAYELVTIAGARMGLGDFRPNCRGVYGQFIITSWDVR